MLLYNCENCNKLWTGTTQVSDFKNEAAEMQICWIQLYN